MVNKLKRMRARVLKTEVGGEKERRVTSKGEETSLLHSFHNHHARLATAKLRP